MLGLSPIEPTWYGSVNRISTPITLSTYEPWISKLAAGGALRETP